MKIVNIIGGIGNQMFQFAFALALKYYHPSEDVYIDTQHYHSLFFKRFKGVNLHNGYELDRIFPKANLPIAKARNLMRISYYIPNYIISRIARKLLPIRKTEYVSPYSRNYIFDKNLLEIVGDCYYEGYWQSIHYYENIKEELINVFSHPEPNEINNALIKDIETCESIGIHVRRGDYLSEPDFKGICDLSYYEKAINIVLSDDKPHVFYVFSNDMKWCKENLEPLMKGNPAVFVTSNTGKNSCWDMFLMTYCKDLIIANSSFSWWGAFLNKKVNRVICPKPWLNRDCEIDIYDPSWILIH